MNNKAPASTENAFNLQTFTEPIFTGSNIANGITIIVFIVGLFIKELDSFKIYFFFGFLAIIILIQMYDIFNYRKKLSNKFKEIKLLENSTNIEIKELRNKCKITQVLNDVNIGFAKIHQIGRSDEPDKKLLKSNLKSMCTKISDAYTKITGTECAACIKLMAYKSVSSHEEINPDIHVFTLCRDENTTGERNNTKKIKHYITKNTSYQKLFEYLKSSKGNYFLENELPFKNDYKNTSFEIYTNFSYKGLPNDWSKEQRLKAWEPMPYKSTLILPIKPHHSLEEEDFDMFGFICVDSNEMNIFDVDRGDVKLLSGISDGLYNLFKLYYPKLVSQRKNSHNGTIPKPEPENISGAKLENNDSQDSDSDPDIDSGMTKS